MTFSCWPGFLGIVGAGGCLDLVDHFRLNAYMRNCRRDPRSVTPTCEPCPELGFLSPGVPRVIGCPATDPAPWYNPSDPPWLQDVAARFYGPEVISWVQSPFGYTEDSSPRVAHRPRRGKLRVEATVRLWGEGCDATRYGMEWFQRTLECQVCSGLQLRLLRDCDATFDPADPVNTGGNWWRDIFAARILVEPLDDEERSDVCCFYRDVLVAIESDDPCSYWVQPSVECVLSAPWRGPGAEDLFPDECRCSPLCPCPTFVDPCETECSPAVVNPRTAQPPVSLGCYCVPWSSCRKICEIPPSSTPGLSDATVSIVVDSPGAPTSNMRVWLWKADAGDGPDVNWDRWRCSKPCATFDIGQLLADDQLVIDGRSRSIYVNRRIGRCPIQVTSFGKPVSWPLLNCSDRFYVAVEYDTYATAPGLVVSTSIYPRECWTV